MILTKASLAIVITIFVNLTYAEPFNGFYVGSSVGYSQSKVKEGSSSWLENYESQYTTIGQDSKSHSASLGLSLGYNHRLQGNYVVGFEIDNNLVNRTANGEAVNYDTSYNEPSDRLISQTRINSFQTLRVKGGYVFDKTLVYGTAGLASARIKRTVTQVDDGIGWWWFDYGTSDSKTSTEIGYVVGMGIEHQLDNKWSLTAKYLYTNFGKVGYSYKGYITEYEIVNVGQQKVKIDNSTIHLGINYSF